MRTNVTAHTAPGSNYPSYVSVNLASDNEHEVEFTVRGERKPDGSCGDTVAARVSSAEFRRMAREMFSFACTQGA